MLKCLCSIFKGLDQSDDEDMDSAQSFDIQMYPEVGHRIRSNTAQKLEKMDIARRKAARTKCINFDDEIIEPDREDFFVKKPVGLLKKQTSSEKEQKSNDTDWPESVKEKKKSPTISKPIQSKLSLQLANTQQVQNKFMEYAKFDGTSQIGATKRINVFLAMPELPEKERNYPLKICVLANAKILEVIINFL